MTKIRYFVLAAAAAFVFTACSAPAGNTPANTANTANASANPAPAFLSDNFVGYGSSITLRNRRVSASVWMRWLGLVRDISRLDPYLPGNSEEVCAPRQSQTVLLNRNLLQTSLWIGFTPTSSAIYGCKDTITISNSPSI